MTAVMLHDAVLLASQQIVNRVAAMRAYMQARTA
jgi:hypothetical protein